MDRGSDLLIPTSTRCLFWLNGFPEVSFEPFFVLFTMHDTIFLHESLLVFSMTLCPFSSV
jgi:hypothetical protein